MADMLSTHTESDIVNFYKNSTVFITGGSGFLGKLLIIKILTVCPDVKVIYLLMKSKNGKSAMERMENITEQPIFDSLKRINPNFRNKIKVISGDCTLENLGMLEEDSLLLQKEVNIVIHSAALLSMQGDIKKLISVNVIGTKRLLTLCKSMEQLKLFKNQVVILGRYHGSYWFSGIGTDLLKILGVLTFCDFLPPHFESIFWYHFTGFFDEISPPDVMRLIEYLWTMARIFLFVSTFASNCEYSEIEEKIYDFPFSYDELHKLTETENIPEAKKLIGEKVNNYTFTKAACEHEIKLVAENFSIPFVVFRPAIVISTLKEPIPGWIENGNGPTSYMIGSLKNVLRVLPCYKDISADLVPADYTINALIASSWYSQKIFSRMQISEPKLPVVFNYTTSGLHSTTWNELNECLDIFKSDSSIDNQKSVILERNFIIYRILSIYYHYLPAIFLDLKNMLVDIEKPRYVKQLLKFEKLIVTLTYFTTTTFHLHEHNMMSCWNELSDKDKQLFPFDPKSIDWKSCFMDYIGGVKKYILKEKFEPKTTNKKPVQETSIYAIILALFAVIFYVVGWGI